MRYLRDVRALLLDLADQAGAHHPTVLADRLMLIIDGAVSNSATLGDDGAVGEAAAFADEVIAAATGERSR